MSFNNTLSKNTSFLQEEGDTIAEMKSLHRTDIHFQTHEKIIYASEWVVIQIVGNSLLWGMIQFDRFGSDPMKRRIIDQVQTWHSQNVLFKNIVSFYIPYFRNYYPRVVFNLSTFSTQFYLVKCPKIRVQFEVRVLLKVG